MTYYTPARRDPKAPAIRINLLSDTQTRPTPGMREAMARAEVGDEQFGDDPSVNLLCDRVADLTAQEPIDDMSNDVRIEGSCLAHACGRQVVVQHPLERTAQPVTQGHGETALGAVGKCCGHIAGEQAREVSDIVAKAYPGLDPRLVTAAGGSVLAHLLDLERRGLVVRQEQRWSKAA